VTPVATSASRKTSDLCPEASGKPIKTGLPLKARAYRFKAYPLTDKPRDLESTGIADVFTLSFRRQLRMTEHRQIDVVALPALD
jgi:hypothetical protein